DRVTILRRMENEVLARDLDHVRHGPDGVDADVVGKEIRKDHEAARALEANGARPGPRLRLECDVAFLQAEPRDERAALGGLIRGLQAGPTLAVLDERQADEPDGAGLLALRDAAEGQGVSFAA